VIDPEPAADELEFRIGQMEEPVSVPQRRELAPPQLVLGLPQLAAGQSRFAEHPDERVDPVDATVDRPQASGEARGPLAAHGTDGASGGHRAAGAVSCAAAGPIGNTAEK